MYSYRCSRYSISIIIYVIPFFVHFRKENTRKKKSAESQGIYNIAQSILLIMYMECNFSFFFLQFFFVVVSAIILRIRKL